MQPSLYNNPLFAQGLAGLVDGIIGNPVEAAQAEALTSQAALNNGTVRYREDIGSAGRSGNLADMLVASLQAGEGFADYAPHIASTMAATPSLGMTPQQMANIAVGAGVQKAQDTFPGLASVLSKRGGGRGGGGRRGSGAPAKTKPLSAGGRTLILRSLGNDADPTTAMSYVTGAEDLISNGIPENEAIARVLGGQSTETVVTDPNDSWLNPMDYFRGPETEDRLSPYQSGLASVVGDGEIGQPDVLAEARAALAAGADRAAVIARLRQNGIDPGGL